MRKKKRTNSTARVYKRKNARVKKALNFSTSKNKSKLT